MTTHALKAWPPYWRRVAERTKTFEVRRDDRDFQTGDYLLLEEWEPTAVTPANIGTLALAGARGEASGKYTGAQLRAAITYVYRGPGLEQGYCVLNLGTVVVQNWGPADA